MNHFQSRRAFGPFAGGIVRNMAAEAEAAAVAAAETAATATAEDEAAQRMQRTSKTSPVVSGLPDDHLESSAAEAIPTQPAAASAARPAAAGPSTPTTSHASAEPKNSPPRRTAPAPARPAASLLTPTSSVTLASPPDRISIRYVETPGDEGVVVEYQKAAQEDEQEPASEEPVSRVRPSRWRPSRKTPALKRHERQCSICRHPEREAIEDDFMDWGSPGEIYFDYRLPSRSAVYRHAHACGLFARRKHNVRFVLERVLDQVHRVDMTPMAIVHAVKLYARITDDGELLDLHRPLPSTRAGNSAKLQKTRAAVNAPKRRAVQSPRKRKSHISSRDTRVFSRDTRTSRNSPNPRAISELTNV